MVVDERDGVVRAAVAEQHRVAETRDHGQQQVGLPDRVETAASSPASWAAATMAASAWLSWVCPARIRSAISSSLSARTRNAFATSAWSRLSSSSGSSATSVSRSPPVTRCSTWARSVPVAYRSIASLVGK